MSLRRYRLADTDGSLNATTANVDSFTAVRAGKIKQVVFSPSIQSITASSRATLVVSRSALNDYGTVSGGGSAAPTQTVAECSYSVNFATSGLSVSANTVVVECNDPITVGEAVYLHVTIGGTTVVFAEVLVVVEE